TGDAEAAVRDLAAAASMLEGVDESYAARALIYLGGLADDLDRGADAVDFQRRAMEGTSRLGAPDPHRSPGARGAGVLAERADPQAAQYALRAIEMCRAGGSQEQLAATLPMAATVCWQVGEYAAAGSLAAEARELLASGPPRIARVVLNAVSAGLAL